METPMKVSQIIFSGFGGIGSVYFSMVEGDANKKVTSHALFYGCDDLFEEYADKCHKLDIGIGYVKKKQGIDLGSLKRVYSLLKEYRPDAIICHTLNTIIPVKIYCLIHKIPLIGVEHTPNQVKTKREWFWCFLSMIFSNKVVLLTDAYLNEYKKRFGFLLPIKKIHVINNGIDLNVFNKRAMPTGNYSIKIGMASRFSSTKDHTTLLLAFDQLRKKYPEQRFELNLAGGGGTLEGMQQLIADQQIEQVHFLGVLDEQELIDFFVDLDIYVHSSLAETMSTSIMQAMACGLPMVCSNIDGINNVIEHGENGLLVESKDVESLYLALCSLFDNKALHNDLATGALNYAKENFSNVRMFDQYHQLLVDS
jgi:glycosyltransferase involved in cell wall biosynthesis